ncbi:MAG: NAD+ synthase [Chloroflexi bacterium]|nr:NAD+ synthase [Chloroflexota bacterium]
MREDVLRRLEIDPELVTQILEHFIREEITKVGFHRAVVALSGGIDSATTCALCARALGPENVLAVRMPYRTSSPSSLEDAQAVIDRFGVQSETVDITPMVEPLFERFPDMDKKRRGNVMARERMIIIYDRSVAFNGLVVGTGNKTEQLLGYTTLFGDSACAINPLGDLYKRQVRQLAAYLDIPPQIIHKPPSADLWVGQTDEEELGFTYDEADQILYLLYDARWTVEDVVELGFPRALVEGIVERVRRNQFKRMPPVIAKLSLRTVGIDFRYPRDWGY